MAAPASLPPELEPLLLDLPLLAPVTIERLHAYVALLQQWNPTINLVSKREASDASLLWTRHIGDGLRLWPLVPRGARHLVDMGSGGGIPGLVLAILGADPARARALEVTLIESDRRKGAFLQEAARQLEVPVTLHSKRIEDVPPVACDVLSARALAPLTQLMTYAAPWYQKNPDMVALWPKGVRVQSELASSQKSWHFDFTLYPSKHATGQEVEGWIVALKNLRAH